jgi:hypothetical protein
MMALTQTLITSPNAIYRFENINFIGPTDIDGTVADNLKVGDFALYIGQQDPVTLAPQSGIEIGNIMFTNCKVTRMGLELGGVKFAETTGGEYQNIIVSNNIMSEMSPNLGSTSFTLIEYPSTPTSQIIEVGNITV